MIHDLRYALRTLRASPAFAASAILALALGIGANAAVFSVVHGVMLKPLPYPESHRLVRIWESNPQQGHQRYEEQQDHAAMCGCDRATPRNWRVDPILAVRDE